MIHYLAYSTINRFANLFGSAGVEFLLIRIFVGYSDQVYGTLANTHEYVKTYVYV